MAGDSPGLAAGKTMAPAAGHVIARRRLEALLSPVPGAVVLLQAPAGFGKSLAALAQPGPSRRVWYNADAADRDPGTLATRLAIALGGASRSLKAEADPAQLAAELVAGMPAELVTLDIDGADRIGPAPQAFAVLTELLDLAADRLALRITTRTRPPIQIERLRLAGRLKDVGPDELRFDLDEARLFAEEVAGRKVRAAALRHLYDAVEGWPAALALCLLDAAGGGRQDALQRYLAEEVIGPARPDVHSLLAELAHRPAGDAISVLARPEVSAGVEWVHRERFFVWPDQAGYRMHSAIRAYLSSQPWPAPVTQGEPDPNPAPKSPADLRIRALGQLEVLVGGRPVPPAEWRPFGALRVLRVLLSQPNFAISGEEAAEVLWPGHQPASALNSFNVSLHALRRILEPNLQRGADSRYVTRESRLYRLRVENIDLDLARFLQLARPAARAPSIEDLEEATKLYRGDFLADVLYMDYPNERREHLKTIYLESLEHLGDLLLSAGATRRGVAALRQLLATDALREDIWARLMRHHLDNGERAAAARAFRSCETALRDGLGVTPADELQELMRQAMSVMAPLGETSELVPAPSGSALAATISRG